MEGTTSNDSSTATYCDFMNCTFSTGERYLIITSLFLIVAISLAGNIPICIAIICSKKRRNSSNLTTLNLVVSDLLITIFCTPFVTLDFFVFGSWVFGRTMCRLVTFVQNTAVLASLMNLLTLTCEKFLAVCFPFRFRLRKKVVCHLMPIAWIVAMADSIAYVQYKKLKNYGEDLYYCIEDWPDTETMQNALIAKATMFFAPLIIMIILHSFTMYKLQKGKRKFQLQLGRTDKGSFRNVVRKQKRQRKAVKIILVTLITIIVCWTPVQIFSLLLMFDFADDFSLQGIHIGFTVCIWLFFSHCSAFPFVYFFMTQKGKETLAGFSKMIRGRRKQIRGKGSLLLETSNTLAGSVRGTSRYSSQRRSSAPLAESRL